jgi:hypothetical protein
LTKPRRSTCPQALAHSDDRAFPHAAFATMEMDVVLRTVLREFTLAPPTDADERWHSRGVAFAPAKGGLAVLQRRTTAADYTATRSEDAPTPA